MVLRNNQIPYMHQHQINSAVQLPVPQSQKKTTDVCCAIIGIIFGLVLFIIACCVYNHANLSKVNYPADNQGNICMNLQDDKGENYPFVYFNDIQDPLNTRHCVKQCPIQGVRPQCYNCTISFYPNYPSSNSLGQFCLPEDQGQKNQLLYNANLFERWNSQKAIDYLLIGLGISIGIALITMILMVLLPRIIVWVVILLAIALLIVTAVVFLLNHHTTLAKASGWAVFLGVLCLIFILVFLGYLIFHRKRISIAGAFLEHASQFLKKHPLTFLYIPLFVILTFLFGLLTMFEYFAFSSMSTPTFSKFSMFYQIKRSPFWIFLLVIQTIWGFSFLRDGFNYIISTSAALYYFQNQVNCINPMKNCMCLNFGSVVGGSFLNGFFYFPSLLVNLICPRADCCCCNLFDLIRTDVYAYVGLTGNSYCPSVRQCQYVCYRSNVCRQNQSTNAIISLASRIFIALASVLIVYWIARDNLVQQRIPPYLLLGIFFIGIYISTYFIDILLNASQGLMIAFLCQIEMDQHGYKDMPICKKQLKDLINQLQVQQGVRQDRQLRDLR